MVDQSKNGAYDEVWKKLRCAVAKGHLFDGWNAVSNTIVTLILESRAHLLAVKFELKTEL